MYLYMYLCMYLCGWMEVGRQVVMYTYKLVQVVGVFACVRELISAEAPGRCRFAVPLSSAMTAAVRMLGFFKSDVQLMREASFGLQLRCKLQIMLRIFLLTSLLLSMPHDLQEPGEEESGECSRGGRCAHERGRRGLEQA